MAGEEWAREQKWTSSSTAVEGEDEVAQVQQRPPSTATKYKATARLAAVQQVCCGLACVLVLASTCMQARTHACVLLLTHACLRASAALLAWCTLAPARMQAHI